jgi:hypothetical protein
MIADVLGRMGHLVEVIRVEEVTVALQLVERGIDRVIEMQCGSRDPRFVGGWRGEVIGHSSIMRVPSDLVKDFIPESSP